MGAGGRWWTDRDDAVFLGHLRVTGNASASARAAGFTPKSAWNRKARITSFARAWEEAMEEAEIRLEMRLLKEAADGTPAQYPGAYQAREPEDFDPWLAMWMLNWHDGRRSGRIRGSVARRTTFDEAIGMLAKEIRTVRRYEERFGRLPGTKGEEGEEG